ncbi:MAG TPA: nucleotide sugar dehydrogenase [Geobacterales bacterium]|nr:nucleotide sugar dehydrogenase [Geobacterales bacterium]
MKVAVAGLWHLGMVTAACLASRGHNVLGFDEAPIIERLQQNIMPVAEPGLRELAAKALSDGRLAYTANASGLAAAQVLWVCYDTPVDKNDVADSEYVVNQTLSLLPYLATGSLVLISSQLPEGTTARLESCWHKNGGSELRFAYSPENLRLGKAIEVFTNPDRVVAGVRTHEDRETIAALLSPFTDRIEWMSVESAEMTKHALNAFLATSVAFINEIAALCEKVGADAEEVERGLKTDVRIGSRAYLHPGSAFAGGTLARDIAFLLEIAERQKVNGYLLAGVWQSNGFHKGWLCRRMPEVLGELAGRRIAILGLAYKPGTDTLRRSGAVEAATWLTQQGATVSAFDPAVRALPDELAATMSLRSNAPDALSGADAVLIATPWPEFRDISVDLLLTRMREPVVFDPGRHLQQALGADSRVRYFAVGRGDPLMRQGDIGQTA